MLEYLEAVRARECQNDSKNSLGNYFNSGVTSGTCLQAFSAPDDALGYGDKSVSRDTITEVFIEFSTHTRQIESANYLKSLSGKSSTQIFPHSALSSVCQQYVLLWTTHSKPPTRRHLPTRTARRRRKSRAVFSLS